MLYILWSMNQSSFFLNYSILFFQHNLLERHSFLSCMVFIKNQLSIYMRVYFWTLYSVILICLSNLMSVSCSFYHRSTIIKLHSTLFFFRVVLPILGSMNFCRNFRINLSIPIKKIPLVFCLRLPQIYRSILEKIRYFNDIEFSDLWTKYIFQFTQVIKRFFQCFVIFNVELFDIFLSDLSQSSSYFLLLSMVCFKCQFPHTHC